MKKLLALLLSSTVAFSAIQAGAAVLPMSEDVVEKETTVTYDEPTPEMMEEMIKKVRPLIDVPEEYKEFGWDFYGGYNYSSPAYWNFYWTDNQNGEISVQCDTEGRITNYNDYSYKSSRNAVLPTTSPKELLPVAESFLKKTAPHLKDMDLRLEDISYASVFYNHSFTYVFTRYENNIPVPENTVRVEVSHVTKTVKSYSSSISMEAKFSSSENLISADKAKEILSENQNMVLSYRLKTEYDDEGNLKSRHAYLVYTPEKGYVSVDAKSGEVYVERNTWTALKAPSLNSSAGGILMDSVAKEESADAEYGGGYQLSEKELEQIAVLESLITKDEAVKVILENNDLYIAENAYLSDARLSKRYDVVPLNENGEKEDKYVWNLTFMTPGEMYLGMSASVDAHDGAIISFNADLPYVYHYEEFGIKEPELKYTKEEAIRIASDFIKKQQPEKFEKIVYSNLNEYAPYKYVENDAGETYALYRAGRINFVRQNEGVDFTYNSFNMGVDRASGKITRYSYTWYDDVEFESPSDAIDKKDALMSLYSNEGFGINYEVNRNYTYVDGVVNSTSAEIVTRAVYSAYSLPSTVIRALDGKLINYNNEEIITSEFDGEYSDMENHWAKETVKRFTWIGYGPEGDLFRPNDSITGKDFILLCENVRIYGDSAEITKLETLTRMDAVKIIIDHLGYGKIALLENVFITDFADNSDFEKEDIGYAAIARGFGLIEGDGENFRPYDTLTRAEALTIIENVIDLGVLNN